MIVRRKPRKEAPEAVERFKRTLQAQLAGRNKRQTAKAAGVPYETLVSWLYKGLGRNRNSIQLAKFCKFLEIKPASLWSEESEARNLAREVEETFAEILEEKREQFARAIRKAIAVAVEPPDFDAAVTTLLQTSVFEATKKAPS
jgi:hypothetical protein